LKKIYRELGASSKIHDVKNGVTLSRFHTIRDKPKPLNSQKITRFISVGRNEPKKNYRQLIEIFCELLNYRKDIHLTLIGVKCESLSQYIPNRFYENVTLIDPSIKKLEPNDVLQIPNEIVCAEYKKADVFLMPSLMESFGIVVIEAFAAGLPVVAFDIDGVNELVIQGQNGLLVQVGNSKGFQDAINELCSDQVRTTFSKSALNTAQQYDWKIVVQEYVEIYREIISEKKDIIHK
jgi:glycosyltransferase involved in cell wall biosynthesis